MFHVLAVWDYIMRYFRSRISFEHMSPILNQGRYLLVFRFERLARACLAVPLVPHHHPEPYCTCNSVPIQTVLCVSQRYVL
jgi:hypothetical protein